MLLSHEKPQVAVVESTVTKIPLINFATLDANVSNFYNLQGLGGDLTFTSNKNLLYLGLNFLFKTIVKKQVKKQDFRPKSYQTKKNFK